MDASRMVRDTYRHALDQVVGLVTIEQVAVKEVPGLVRARVSAADRLHDAAVGLLAAERGDADYVDVLTEFVDAVADYGAARPDRVTGGPS